MRLKLIEDLANYMTLHALAFESVIVLLVFGSILDKLIFSNLEFLYQLAIKLYSRFCLFVY